MNYSIVNRLSQGLDTTTPLTFYRSRNKPYCGVLSYPSAVDTAALFDTGILELICGWDYIKKRDTYKLLAMIRASGTQDLWPVWVEWHHIPNIGNGTEIENRARVVATKWSSNWAMDDSALPSRIPPHTLVSRGADVRVRRFAALGVPTEYVDAVWAAMQRISHDVRPDLWIENGAC